MRFWIKSALVIIPALVLLGCGTSGEVQEEEAAPPAAEAPAPQPTTAPAATQEPAESGPMGPAPWETEEAARDDSGFFKQDSSMGMEAGLPDTRVIYFDFDKSNIKGEFESTVLEHAEYLIANPNVSVTLEGHCDERGTREYNIALGERRAASVERMLILQGVSSVQINTISYGEERPAALGHDEDAWALNRRTEFIYN